MRTRQFEWGELKVTVTNIPDCAATFDAEGAPYRPCYLVTVTRGMGPDETFYSCRAWGSLHDAATGNRRRHTHMGAMVLDELTSAYYDLEEFVILAAPKRLNHLRRLVRLIEAAQAFGEPLAAANEALREEGLL